MMDRESLSEWAKDKPLSILQLDPADRAVLRIAGESIWWLFIHFIIIASKYWIKVIVVHCESFVNGESRIHRQYVKHLVQRNYLGIPNHTKTKMKENVQKVCEHSKVEGNNVWIVWWILQVQWFYQSEHHTCLYCCLCCTYIYVGSSDVQNAISEWFGYKVFNLLRFYRFLRAANPIPYACICAYMYDCVRKLFSLHIHYSVH